ncbi:MAG: glycine cleavage system aminomethyltransferase GcvT [Atribacterota bacterium]|nr:glycine cleavage system aminomethyltransferase GcvT [Atribacterota bacterium]MDD4289495.1 glycine cleavage system aminomethyltransferase GcvT [Atribacterota bacterium]
MTDNNNNNELLLTPLHQEHIKLNARMIPFDGFDMPVQYSSIIEEHLTVRQKVGIFDVCHMGEIEIKGKDALPFVDYLLTNKITNIKDGYIKYSPMCYPHGGQVDDLFVYKISNRFILLVVNASPGYSEKDMNWIKEQSTGFDVKITNKSKEYGEVAIQGPLAEKLLNPFFKSDIFLSDLKRFQFIYGILFGKEVLISRTGYTGEDGFEIYTTNSSDIIDIWNNSLEEGIKYDIKPCGLGSRDTTRFEVGYWLYGNEIDETINPLESGQDWTVKLNKKDFIGKESLLKVQQEGTKRKLVGLSVPQGGIPRHGMEVWYNNKKIGYITSGNYCPSLKKVYAMALIDKVYSEIGTKINVIIRNRPVAAEVVNIPFLLPVNKR